MTKSSGEVTSNVTTDIIKVISNIKISISDNSNTKFVQVIRSSLVVSLIYSIIIMLTAINLDHQLNTWYVKIDYILAYLPLTFYYH